MSVDQNIAWESYRQANGIARKRAWLPCVDCSSERWVDSRQYEKPNYTGRCGDCHLRLRGEDASRWNGGKEKQSAGYIRILVQPDDKFACMRDVRGYVYEHRLVMAESLDRSLSTYEHVHHINRDKADNRIENLELVSSHEHVLITKLESRIQTLETQVASLQTELLGRRVN